jgi:P4 family phage/plasmid primase-like protien
MITVPPALRQYNQFILHLQKVPCDYRSGKTANPHEPAIWLDADTALQIAELWGEGYGVGFVFTENDPFFFLDMDHCLDNGQWSPLSLQLFEYLKGAYCEISQSGKGGHIIASGTPPAHGCRNDAYGLEFYHEKRYVALTGNGAIGDASFDASSLLPGLVATYFPPDDAQTGAQEWTTGPCPEWYGPTDDGVLTQRAMASQSVNNAFGVKASFADLWNANGPVLGKFYPDPKREYDASSADAALAWHLAFWTGKDCDRIRRLMEQSKLKRDKWEREDYLPRTIHSAVARLTDVLHDKRPEPSEGVTLNGVETNLLHQGTQDSVAQIFTQRMVGKMLFNHTRKAWYEWDGTRWRLEQTDKAFDFARDLARQANSECKSSIGSAPFCTGVERMARADRTLAVAGMEFDRDNYLLNTPSGTLDLRTGALRPHNPDDRITLCTAVSPSSDGGAAFESFLAEITQNNRELSEFLQVSSGACLSGAVEVHWILFWIGRGRNGKNTLGDLMQDAMGDYARKVPMSTLMAKLHEGHPTEIANLQGVRLAVSSEINEGAYWDEARINELTGDATLSARFMRCDLFEFKRTHKHLIYGNHRPQLRAVGDAIKSRIKIVPFRESFVGREDADLPRRLRENLGYVLGWLVEGHSKWLSADKRLPRCQSVEEETADYFASQSTVEMWLSERVEILNPDYRVASSLPKAGDLYRDYRIWKETRGENPVSMTRWADSMKQFVKIKSNGVRYRGLMLIPLGGEIPFPLSPNAQTNYAN